MAKFGKHCSQEFKELEEKKNYQKIVHANSTYCVCLFSVEITAIFHIREIYRSNLENK